MPLGRSSLLRGSLFKGGLFDGLLYGADDAIQPADDFLIIPRRKPRSKKVTERVTVRKNIEEDELLLMVLMH